MPILLPVMMFLMMLNDACHRAAPAGVDGGYCAVRGIVKQDGDAVGRGNADAHAALGSDERIGVVEQRGLLVGRKGEERGRNEPDVVGMRLARQQQAAVGNSKFAGEPLAALRHVLRAVAAIVRGIESRVRFIGSERCGIGVAVVAHRAERHYVPLVENRIFQHA